MAKTIEAILEEIRTKLKEAEDGNFIFHFWFTDETMNFLLSNTKPTVDGRHLVFVSDSHQIRFELGTAREELVIGPSGSWRILEIEYHGEKIYEIKSTEISGKRFHEI